MPLTDMNFLPGVGAPGFLLSFLVKEIYIMETNLILGIVFFILGTFLMPLGLREQQKQKKVLLISAAVLSDILGVLFIFNIL